MVSGCKLFKFCERKEEESGIEVGGIPRIQRDYLGKG